MPLAKQNVAHNTKLLDELRKIDMCKFSNRPIWEVDLAFVDELVTLLLAGERAKEMA